MDFVLALTAFFGQRPEGRLYQTLPASICLFLLCLGLATHQLPGFQGLPVLTQVYLSADAVPYSLYLNFDKTLMGIFILGCGRCLIATKADASLMLKQTLPKALALIALLMVCAFALALVRFDPKLPDVFPLWTITNLLFTCVAEEAFFRGFIQKKLTAFLAPLKGGVYLALVLTALFFGLSHYPGGQKYVLLASIAGLGYGWIYLSTKRIEASILAHFWPEFSAFSLFHLSYAKDRFCLRGQVWQFKIKPMFILIKSLLVVLLYRILECGFCVFRGYKKSLLLFCIINSIVLNKAHPLYLACRSGMPSFPEAGDVRSNNVKFGLIN